MSALIPLAVSTIGSETIQTVNARDLHAFLGSGAQFTDWIRDRIQQYNFIENQDFVSFSPSGEKGRPRLEYHVSLDMAKELAMVERTEKGKEARQYFLACERLALQPPPALPVLPSVADELALIRTAADLFAYLGGGTARDRLMLLDQARNVMNSGQRLLAGPAGSMSQDSMYSVAERVTILGYRLTVSQEATYIPNAGKRVAEEWRARYPEQPIEQEPRYVHGAIRGVNAYHSREVEWVDAIIQAYMASMAVPCGTQP